MQLYPHDGSMVAWVYLTYMKWLIFLWVFMYSKYTICPSMDPMGTKKFQMFNQHVFQFMFLWIPPFFSLEEKMVMFPWKVAYHGLLFEFGEEFSFLTVYVSQKKGFCMFTSDLHGSL